MPGKDIFHLATNNFLIRNVGRDVLFHHSSNESPRAKQADLAGAMGQRAGWLDWVLMWGAAPLPKVAFVELKSLDQRVSGEQEEFITHIHDIGIPHRIVHMDESDMDASLARFRDALVSLGVPFKTGAPSLGASPAQR